MRAIRHRVTIEPLDSFRDDPNEWKRLAQASRNIFASWEWISTWWEHFGRGEQLVASRRATDGTLVALVPLYRATVGPLRLLRFMGHGTGDQLGPIAAQRDATLAGETLVQAVAETRPAWDVFLAEEMPGDAPWRLDLRGQTLNRRGSPVIRFAEHSSWDDYLETRSRNLRREIRHHERRLMRKYRVRVRTTDDARRLGQDLDILFGLHAARWAGTPSSFRRQHRFHRAFASLALREGWLRLAFLELDGTPVAARYDFRFGGVHSAYNGGRDPRLARESVGLVLRTRTMRLALDEGATEYRFLRGDEPYKYRFADHDPGLETVAVARGALGIAAVKIVPFVRGSRSVKGLARGLLSAGRRRDPTERPPLTA